MSGNQPSKSDTTHEAWCSNCGQPFAVSELAAIKEQAVQCPHCGQRHRSHWEESALDFQMGVELEALNV